MRKFLLATLALTSLSTFAVTPDVGEINLIQYPAGISSIEVPGSYTLNRACTGFFTLSRNGEVIKRIAPAHEDAVYITDGESRLKDLPGGIHCTFFKDQATSPAKANGDYVVTIPAGVLCLSNGSYNEEMTYNYVIKTGKIESVSTLPAEGANIEAKDFGRFELIFPEGSTPNYTGGMEFTARSDDEFSFNYQIIDNKIIFNVTPVPSTPTQLFMTFKAGSLSFTTADGKKVVMYSPDTDDKTYVIKWNFVVPVPIPEISPEEGSYDKFVSQKAFTDSYGNEKYAFFNIVLPSEDPIMYILPYKAQLCPVNAAGEAIISNTNTQLQIVKNLADENGRTFSLCDINVLNQKSESTLAPAPGKYKIYIPQGAYQTKSGAKNQAMYFDYEIIESEGGLPAYTIVPDPAKPIEALDGIAITFPSANEVSWRQGYYVTIVNDITEYCLQGYVDEENPQTAYFNIPAPIVEAGEWEVSYSGSAISVDGIGTPMNFTYLVKPGELSGVNTIAAAEGYDIYTITGVCVGHQLPKSAVDALNPGLYIINAKKVLVK